MDFKYSFFLMALILGNLCFGVNCSSYNGKPGCPADSCDEVIDPRYPTYGGCVPKSLGGGGMSEQQAYSECGQQNKVVYNYGNSNWGCGGCVNGYVNQGGACVSNSTNNTNSDVTDTDSTNSELTPEQACSLQMVGFAPMCSGNCEIVDNQCVPKGSKLSAAAKESLRCSQYGAGECEDNGCEYNGACGAKSSTPKDYQQAKDKGATDERKKIAEEKGREAERLKQEACYEKGTKEGDTSAEKLSKVCSIHAPVYRVVAAGLMASISGIVWSKTNKEVDKIEQNISHLKKIRDAIVENQGKGLSDCAENDFDNQEKPHCYCYTPGGSVNRSRDPAGVCAALFPYYRPPVVSNTPTLKGCVRMDGTFDRDCQCRQQVSNGQNNCMKLQTISTTGLGGNSIGAIGDAGRAANNIFSGDYAGASAYNPAGGRSLARLGKRQAEKALGKPAGTIDKFVNDKIKALVSSPKLASIGNNANQRNAGINSIASGLPNALKSELDKKTGGIISKADKGYSGGGGSRRRGRISNNDNEIDFGESVDFSVDMDDEKTEEIMAKNFNYKNSDVFQRSSASIFKVLSVRYQRSAYRRLFREEDVIEADKPSDNDIRR